MGNVLTQDIPAFIIGVSTLVSGAKTIANTNVTATSKILLTANFTAGTTTSTGVLAVSSQTAGVGFTVQSNNILDVAPFTYMIIG